MNSADSFVTGYKAIIQAYLDVLPHIELSGPTYLREVLELANSKAREVTDGSVYHILMIITDGDIDDFPVTRSLIIEASRLPISIIIVGVGSENFSNMIRLDADSGPLRDQRLNESSRDVVQFVPFRNYSSSPTQLSTKVLEEIPSQIESYMKHAHLNPLYINSELAIL